MAYDLSQPRPVLPFPHLNTTLQYSPPGANSSSLGCTTDAPRRAIALRLNEHVLAQIKALVKQERKLGGTKSQQSVNRSLRIDLGGNPALIINGVSYPLSLDPTAAETSPTPELVRSSRYAAQPLQPIATVDHRATIKPGAGAQAVRDIARVGHTLRENREAAEKEREGRRAVLLESSTPLARSASLQKTIAHSSSAAAPPLRSGSPAPPRQPSRLTAVPVKPPLGTAAALATTGRPPSSSFRIGKSAKSTATSVSATSSTSPEEIVPVVAPAITPATPNSPTGSSPAESSSSSQHSSHVNSHASVSSTGRTSLSSTGNSVGAASPVHDAVPLPGVAIRVGGGGLMKGKDTLKKEKRKEDRSSSTDKKSRVGSSPVKPPTATAKTTSPAKARETDQNTKASQSKSKIRLVESDSSSSESYIERMPIAAASGSSTNVAATESKTSTVVTKHAASVPSKTRSSLNKRLSSAAEVVSDADSATARTNTETSKKKRKLLNGLDSGADEPQGAMSSSSRAPTPISSPRLPPIPRIKRKTSDESKSKETATTSASSATKRGKKRPKEERWYSSSSDEDAEGEPEPPEEGELEPEPAGGSTRSSDSSRTKRRRTISAPENGLAPGSGNLLAQNASSDSETASRGRPRSALPSHMAVAGRKSAPGSPLRASSIAPAATDDHSKSTTSSYPATLPRDVSYSDLVAHFTAVYKTYASLHHLLMCEKQALEGGEPGDFELATTSKMVKRLEGVRQELEGTRRRIEDWAKDNVAKDNVAYDGGKGQTV